MNKALFKGVFVAATIFACAPAQAADLPVYKAAPLAPEIMSWTGGYVGLALGYKQQNTDWTTTCLGLNGFFCNPNPTAINPFFVDTSSPRRFEEGSFRVGGYVGYNWQVLPQWVIGVEADLAWADGKATSTGIVGCTVFCGFLPLSSAGDSSSIRTTWDASVRGRLGFLVQPNWLIYATGGPAIQQVEANVTCTGVAVWCVANRSQTIGSTLGGYTVGGGVEWMIAPHWLLRGEYRFSEFRKFGPTFFINTGDDVFTSMKLQTHIATGGIAYKF